MTETILEIKNLKKIIRKKRSSQRYLPQCQKGGGYLNYWFFRFRKINLPSLY